MIEPTHLYFNLDEYRQRLSILRARMEANGIDVLLIHAP